MSYNFSFENIAESPNEVLEISSDILLCYNHNETTENQKVNYEIPQNFVQFHLCEKGEGVFLFNQNAYSFSVLEQNMLLLYNPQKQLPVNLEVKEDSCLISIFISIEKIHLLFLNECQWIDFLNEENKDKKYYQQKMISPSILSILRQMTGNSWHKSVYKLFLKAKIYEFLSLYFNKNNENNEQCPFLSDEKNIAKIRLAKKFLIERMTSPPSLQEIADYSGLTLKRLKTGFKQVYGESVYNFLLDYKMQTAQKMLENTNLNINEISLKLGYSTPSHFISAFKKKFGTTPKKFGKEVC